MSKKIIVIIMILSLFLVSCSKQGDNQIDMQEGIIDTIIPPESDLNQLMNYRNVGSNAINSYQQNIFNRLYENIGLNQTIIDFDASENFIYVLYKKNTTENGVDFGDSLNVYHIEDGSYKSTIKLLESNNITAFAVASDRLYTYDYKIGDIKVYSIKGELEKIINLKTPLLMVEKMQADTLGKVYIKATTNNILGKSVIYAMDHKDKAPHIITTDIFLDLLEYSYDDFLNSPNIYIQDFSIKDNQSILVRVIPERLCIYNTKDKVIEGISYIPDSAKLMEFDSGMLYYVPDFKLSLLSNSYANFSSEGSQDFVGRILINNKFTWSIDPLSLTDFKLADIIIPHSEKVQRTKMKQNNKYLFFLDYSISSEGNFENTINRIAK
ncbi:UNVERIFIED_CONTAM: hypothetical protein Cloal_3805 [Acetivibrio alkalicellulosi]